MIRNVLVAVALILGVASATPVFAHASLLSSDPADGAVLASPPAMLSLTFNEPVSITELQLIDSDGVAHPIADAHPLGSSVIGTMPGGLPEGTDALSWRVISADGHPVGATLVFSVGKATANAGAVQPHPAPGLYPAIWLLGFVLYAALFVGIGGAFFATWIAPPGALPRFASRAMRWTNGAGMVAAAVSVGLEGLDALGADFGHLGEAATWVAGFSASYGATVIVCLIAFLCALAAMVVQIRQWSRLLSLVGLLGTGIALSLSGHASDAPPRSLTSAAVFLHAVAAAFWVGALFPLAVLLGGRQQPGAKLALARFSKSIPFAIVPLVAAGVTLALAQMLNLSDLWTTDYGRLLSAKLAAVLVLFGLAAQNRFRLTARVAAGDRRGTLALTRSIWIELGLMAIVLGVVAGWRFTPPPRSLFATAATLPLYTMAASADGATMANVNVLPGHVGKNQIVVEVTNEEMRPIDVQGVTVSISSPDAGIQPITRVATKSTGGVWKIDEITFPVVGRWKLSVEVQLSEFQDIQLESQIAITR